MCFNKDSSSLLIFCHFSGKYDYLLAGLGQRFGQFFWAPIAVERYQKRPGYVPGRRLMIHFYSQIPCHLGWSAIGFKSVFLYQILDRYSKLFGIMTVSIIIIILLSLLLLLFTYI